MDPVINASMTNASDIAFATETDLALGVSLNLVPVLFLLLGGFFFREAGSVRSKNASVILMKCFLNLSVGATFFWLFGGGVALGESAGGIIGIQANLTALSGGVDLGGIVLTKWIILLMYSLTVCAILSGSISERSTLESYMFWCGAANGICFPLIAHWCWNKNGWLYEFGYVDIAGSGVVHAYGAFASIAAVWLLGPRLERIGNGTEWIEASKVFVSHSALMQSLGTILIVAGFYAFTGMSTLLLHLDDSEAILHYSSALINTCIASAGGGLTALAISRVFMHNYMLENVNMGMLNGSVAISAGCSLYSAYDSFIVGCLSTLVCFSTRKLVLRLRLDDPLNGIAMHGGAGVVGVLGVGLFANDPDGLVQGLFHGGYELIYKQLVGLLVITTFAFLSTLLVFYPWKVLGALRLSEEEELNGLDKTLCAPAYPEVSAKSDFIQFREFLTAHQMHEDYINYREEFKIWMTIEKLASQARVSSNTDNLEQEVNQSETSTGCSSISGQPMFNSSSNAVDGQDKDIGSYAHPSHEYDYNIPGRYRQIKSTSQTTKNSMWTVNCDYQV
eukprot:CFRG2872T1